MKNMNRRWIPPFLATVGLALLLSRAQPDLVVASAPLPSAADARLTATGTILTFTGQPGNGAEGQNLTTQPAVVVREDRKSTRLNSSHIQKSRMPSSA